jgi:hypothetical protein
MANIRVKAALDRIGRDLHKTSQYVHAYGGISAKDAAVIERDAEAIIEMAAMIVERARAAQPAYRHTAHGVVTKVRKALGYGS